MPEHKGPDLQEDRHLPKYDYISFMERVTSGKSGVPDSGSGDGEAQMGSNNVH